MLVTLGPLTLVIIIGVNSSLRLPQKPVCLLCVSVVRDTSYIRDSLLSSSREREIPVRVVDSSLSPLSL